MLHIDTGLGFLGGLVLALAVIAGAIVLIWLLVAARQAHDVVVEEDEDRHAHPDPGTPPQS